MRATSSSRATQSASLTALISTTWEGPTSNGSSRPRDRAAAVAAASGRVSCRANSVASPRTRTATATMVPPHSQSDCWTCAWMVAIGAFTPTPQLEYLLLAKACRTSAPSKLVVSYARRRRASSRSRPGTRVPTSRPSSRAFATISPLPSQIVEFHCDGSPCPISNGRNTAGRSARLRTYRSWSPSRIGTATLKTTSREARPVKRFETTGR